ncbi:phosphotransferase [Actinomadura sp. 9N407]|uniref:phosphotransferase n=1 Tax=Actinomadura sp. 9N407 TaxID=3375154 RepID=UPI0037B48473
MEDLGAREADPLDGTRAMTVDQVANGLRGLARLHSEYWEPSRAPRPELGWVKTWKPTKGWRVGLAKRAPMGYATAEATLPSEVRRHAPARLVDLWARYVTTLGDGPLTLLHGDAHIGNTYLLPGGDVGFLDWQVVRRGHWSQDVGYFLAGSLTTEDRRRSEADLVEEYRRALRLPADRLPTSGEAWLRYRASAVHGLVIWLSTLGSVGYQSARVSRTLVDRYAAAFADHGTVEALDRVEDGVTSRPA